MARLFFAVGVTPEIAAGLRSVCAALETSVAASCLRFIDLEQAHYTLRFLGEQAPDRQAAAVRAARVAARDALHFDVAPESLGVFPDERRAHTLWVGAGRGAHNLVAPAARLAAALHGE